MSEARPTAAHETRTYKPFDTLMVIEQGAAQAPVHVAGYVPVESAFVIRQREGESPEAFGARVEETVRGVRGVSEIRYFRGPDASDPARAAREKILGLVSDTLVSSA